MSKITPVLMSGGAGTRLWPLSTKGRPKQFHALGGTRTLIQETALRFTTEAFAPPMVIGNAAHADLTRAQLAEVGVAASILILEPEGRHTAAAACVSALAAVEAGAELILLLSADARIADPAALRAAVALGAPAAEAGALVIFGIKPTGPETGYGYIRAGAGDGPVRRVAAFVEKPDLATAQTYVADPAYSWNAGIFLFRPELFLAEAERTAPALVAAARAAFAQAAREGDALRLGEAFRAVPSVAVDVAVFERTDKAVVVGADVGWSDVGAYDALWAEGAKTPSGDVLQGPVLTAGTANNLAISDGPVVVLAGVEDLAVVVDNGVVLVTRRDAPGAVRAAVEAVKKAGRDDLL
ncbi:MAG TPA: sugar phosphate nucleotidyltransferase [Phenylobacterium sp.]|uniref:mannose-1-phosphate guanylyltransferase n=1 Tax=Phenylobacterium sp. TaxID=1871053 RepID=UPI002C726CF6|nr:sugar phosphate nucleotidyltransferase [Phenylobacterium sp.]HXA39971.1 sugar phosphate nucleotidyltransferase [Phenylobacterium sp.]